jgi:hypothetical protein
MFDYDNDGWLDIFTTHGDAHHEYVQENTLMRNKGDGTFEDVSDRSGQHFKEKYVGRGAAWGDFDNDGNVDLVISNLNDRPILLRNDGGDKLNNWLTVDAKLQFPTGTRDAIGARVTVSRISFRPAATCRKATRGSTLAWERRRLPIRWRSAGRMEQSRRWRKLKQTSF